MPRAVCSITTSDIRLVVLAVVVAVGGCSPPHERLNSPPQGWTSRQADMQQHYVYMLDNAMLSEMHVSDVHFVPHTASLNGLGARRLDRYAALLKESGGELRYDTELRDNKLVDARLASVRDYLKAAGADSSKVTVVSGAVRADGIPASEGESGYERINDIGGGQSKTSFFGAGSPSGSED